MGLSCARCGGNRSYCIDRLRASGHCIACTRISCSSAGARGTGRDINWQIRKCRCITSHYWVACRSSNTRAGCHHIDIGDNSSRTSNRRVAVAGIGALCHASWPNIGRGKCGVAVATSGGHKIICATTCYRCARRCGCGPSSYNTEASSGTLVTRTSWTSISLKD